MTSSKSASFVIEIETAENTGKPADFFDERGSPSPKKSTPKQIKENFDWNVQILSSKSVNLSSLKCDLILTIFSK